MKLQIKKLKNNRQSYTYFLLSIKNKSFSFFRKAETAEKPTRPKHPSKGNELVEIAKYFIKDRVLNKDKIIRNEENVIEEKYAHRY